MRTDAATQPGGGAVAHCLSGTDYRILSIDGSFLEMLGRERGEVIGRRGRDFTCADDHALNRTLQTRLEEEDVPFAITKRYVRSDGSLLWVNTTVTKFADGIGGSRLLVTSRALGEPIVDGTLARNLRTARRLCAAIQGGKAAFGADLIGAPPTEALLLLYTAELEGTVLTGAEIAERLERSWSATARWLHVLLDRGLIEVEGGAALCAEAPLRIGQGCEAALGQLLAALSA
ncbi:PAS domain-containing protein [Sphingomonas sp. ac-8]|uniref:PAS domain-containing protein n=1 Tax=Sphingomonas sp. ac-8 TaxID=3242977 RepID=UPI003A7FEB05